MMARQGNLFQPETHGAVQIMDPLREAMQHHLTALLLEVQDVFPLDDDTDLRCSVHNLDLANRKARSRPLHALRDHGRKRTARA